MTLSDILALKFPGLDFTKDVRLQDDGNGVYINEWNLETPIPSAQTLQQWEQELDLVYRQKLVREERAKAYPSWREQEDMKYHDAIATDGITDRWLTAISAVKDTYPIPTE